MDLLNWLIVSGHLYRSSDLSILYDTIKITKQFGLEREIKAIIPSCPTIRGVIITTFTKRRQRITRLGMILTNEAIEMISDLYRLNNRYVDSWSLIFELEQRMKISEENMEKFIEDLKELNLPLAVKVLTEDLEVKIPVEILARGPEALKAFNEALSDGETEVNQGTTIFLGLERVGKTSTIKSFLNYPFDLTEDITDAIANTQTVCTQDSNNELNWKETTHDHSGVTSIYEEKLADVIVKELSQIEKEEKVGVTAEPLLPDIGVTAKTSTGDIQGQSSPGPSRSADREPESKNTQQINEVPKNITSIVEEKMKFTEEATTEWRKSSKEFIMKILDFGGQPIYHVIQRIFLVSFAVVCVVFNLEDDLDSPAEVRDPTTGEKYMHRMTNLEFILYWIRSVYTNSRDSKIDDNQLSPPVLVIGTHLGSIGGNEEEQKNEAEKIFSKIRQAIAGKPYEAMVSTFFAIENSLPFPESKASSIMKQIYKFAKKMVRTLPFKWLLVQQEIQKKKKTYIYLPTNQVYICCLS
ncbi:uncharacterized protein LOC117113730 [Anneissia japonica]|uniref:uncharacterized protein LOC117113730 n=1 Tax=Anneissia japonica TaxID=1529436 RepID=UPI001425725A|nr:uncharacterized protein LOC117113730 [Anneissia japonica]